MTKSLFIVAYKRQKILFKTLRKLKLCKNYKEFRILIIYQDVDKNTLRKIKKIDPNIDVIKTQYSKKKSALYKVCRNSFIGFKKCFENYKSEYVIFLEDDILPSYDFLEFHNYIISRYRSDKKFFAVNSFSREYKNNINSVFNSNKNFSYSKFMYGIGKGWSVSFEKWFILKKMYKEVLKFQPNVAFDVFFDKEIKTKFFVVMPYRSRCLEQVSHGMHSKIDDVNNPHWIDWKKSFLAKKNYKIKDYNFIYNMKFSWRKDCLNYTLFNIFKVKIKHTKYYIQILIKNIIGQNKYYLIRNYIKESFF